MNVLLYYMRGFEDLYYAVSDAVFPLSCFLLLSYTMMAIVSPMKAACITSIAIAIGPVGNALPVIGLLGSLVITKSIISTTQKSWAIPATRKKIPKFRLNSKEFEAWIRCKIPAIAVVAAAT